MEKMNEMVAGTSAISVKPSMYSDREIKEILSEISDAEIKAEEKAAAIKAKRIANLEIAKEHKEMKAIKTKFIKLTEVIQNADKADLASVKDKCREAAKELFSKVKAALIMPECEGLKGNARRMKFALIARALGEQLEKAEHPVFRNAGYMLLSASGRSMDAIGTVVCSRETEGYYKVTIGDICYELNIQI